VTLPNDIVCVKTRAKAYRSKGKKVYTTVMTISDVNRFFIDTIQPTEPADLGEADVKA